MENKANKISYIIIAIALIVIAFVSYLYLDSKKQYEVVVTGLTEEKDILTDEYVSLATDFDSLSSNNETLNLMLEQEREKIAQLIEEIKTVNATNSAKIREYKKELSSLRTVMKGFLVQIDSLNQRNTVLSKENKEYKKQYAKMQENFKVLEQQKEKLVEKVEVASQLETYGLEVEGLSSKGKSIRRIRNATKIKVCFTILKNITASVGKKNVYVRIMRPDQSLLIDALDNKFLFEGKQINYSATREIEYASQNLDVCLYYSAAEGELMPGKYVVDIFADGFNIGTGEFDLK